MRGAACARLLMSRPASSSGSTSACTSSAGCRWCSLGVAIMGLGFALHPARGLRHLHLPRLGLLHDPAVRAPLGARAAVHQASPRDSSSTASGSSTARCWPRFCRPSGSDAASSTRSTAPHAGARPEDRRHRRRHRPVDAAARPQGVHEQPHGDRHGRRRRRLVRPPAARHAASCRPATSATASPRWPRPSR